MQSDFPWELFSFPSSMYLLLRQGMGQEPDRFLTDSKAHLGFFVGCPYYSREFVYGMSALFHTGEEYTHER